MEIELTQIILALLGGTTVGGIIEAVRYCTCCDVLPLGYCGVGRLCCLYFGY